MICKLRDLIQIKNGKDYRTLQQGTIPVYGSGGVMTHIDEYLYDGESVLLPRKGTLDNIMYVNGKFWTVDTMYWTVVNKDRVLPKYLYYYLSLLNLSSRDSGSTLPSMTFESYYSLDVKIPPIELQRKVVDAITPIEEKITRNNEINDNLYEQLELIFRYKCKAEVKHPNNVLSDICSYSADKIAVSELTVFSYYSTENMLPNKAGAIDATNLPTCNLTTKCHNGDTLISNIRPYFRKIAYITNVAGCSSDVLCFTPKEKHLSAFLFCTLYEDCFFDYMLAGNKGTKMPRGDKQLIMKYPVSIPSPNNLRTFNEVAAPILELISLHKMANKELYNLRNSLLPLLINGQATISV